MVGGHDDHTAPQSSVYALGVHAMDVATRDHTVVSH